jgi:hypothetical protein
MRYGQNLKKDDYVMLGMLQKLAFFESISLFVWLVADDWC